MSSSTVVNLVNKEADREQAKAYQDSADSCLRQGQVDEAIEYYLKTIQVRPIGGKPYLQLRHLHLNSQQVERAIAVYRQVAQQQPHYHEPHLSLAKLLTKKGALPEAYCAYQKATYCLNFAHNREWVKNYWNEDRVSQGPNFIIIGAEKCGTSSLHHYIAEHPQVLEAAEKEIHFFTQQFEQGKDWYLAHFPPLLKASEYQVGEASTSYIGCKNNAPKRTFELLPEVKLLAVLRDPVERAISNYHQLVRLGRESRSLEEATAAEMDILQGVENPLSHDSEYWRVGRGCIWNSLYVYFLEQWMHVFPKEQFLILKSEDLFQDPKPTTKQVFEFLELPEFGQSDYKVLNSGGSYPQAEESIRKAMAEFFEPHNRKLEQLLGRNFGWEG